MSKLKNTKRFDDFDAHFPGFINRELSEFVKENCFLGTQYLFVSRVNSTIQRGYCTNCKTDYLLPSGKTIKHNEDLLCQECKHLLQAKSMGRGRGKLIHHAYFIWYEKSTIDKNAIICTGFKVKQDYSDKIEIETEFIPVMRCVFKKGSAVMALRDHYSTGFFANRRVHYKDGWRFAAKPHSIMGKHYFTYSSYQSMDSIRASIQGTLFQYSMWENYSKTNMDMVTFFSAFAKYPFIEYLIKMGMTELAGQIVNRTPIYNAVNYRGKTMERILGLSKLELNEWKSSSLDNMEAGTLNAFKLMRDQGVPVKWETASRFGSLFDGSYYKGAMDRIMQFTTFERMIRYAESQMRKHKKKFGCMTTVVTDWRDYINECESLQMDLSEERFLFPNDLHAAHQKNRAKVKLMEDPHIAAQIEERQTSLKKFIYSNDQYLIRPIGSMEELFDEGGALVHCIGGYADRYAAGGIIILCIRKRTEPDKPFYTMELVLPSLLVSQCRGYENCAMTKDVRSFVDEFIAKKLLVGKRKRIDVTGIHTNQLQEAVV